MRKNDIIKDINYLKNKNSARYNKYLRNARLYTWTPGLSLKQIGNSQVVGYYDLNTYGEDNTSSIQENVVASCVDTIVSKIASTKVRPFFNTVHGSFRDLQVTKQTQQFFDQFFEEQDVNKVISLAFRDACIFDTGWVFIEGAQILRALPWNVYTDPAEYTYDTVSHLAYEMRDSDNNPQYLYYNKKDKVKATYYESTGKVDIQAWDKDIPFISLHYSNPLLSNTCTSVTDLLYGIQMEIDQLLQKIEDASKLNPALTFFVPEGSSIKSNQLDNRIGNIVSYRATPSMTGSPVTVSTPAFIDPQYMSLLAQLKQDAYEMVGISQLSATSRKPTGLDSGKALQTMENIESDRFETQLNQVIRTYVNLAKLYVSIQDPESTILPESLMREEISWKEIQEAMKKMNIQFSGADALSKDPQTKLSQLQVLADAGLLPRSRIATLMEIPDLEQGYSIANNALNAVLAVIDDCLTKNIFEVPFYVPLDLLKEEIVNTMLSLKAADSQGNKEDIDKLQKLYEITFQGQQYVNAVISTEAANDQMDEANKQMMQSNEALMSQQQAQIEGE